MHLCKCERFFKAKKCYCSFRLEAKITLSKRNKKAHTKRTENMGPFFHLCARIESETDPISLHLASKQIFFKAKPAHPSQKQYKYMQNRRSGKASAYMYSVHDTHDHSTVTLRLKLHERTYI
jgi:hypothetical protein